MDNKILRSGKVFYKNIYVGIIQETDDGYSFLYDKNYKDNPNSEPISLTMPLTKDKYTSKTFFPFFDGLIPEGWLLDIASRNWKLNPNDRMGLLLTVCNDCIGAVSVKENIYE